MSRRSILAALALLAASPGFAAEPQRAWLPDLGDGTYRNPVLAGDYSDPDVVRVGSYYYLTASSFTNTPAVMCMAETRTMPSAMPLSAQVRATSSVIRTRPRRRGSSKVR